MYPNVRPLSCLNYISYGRIDELFGSDRSDEYKKESWLSRAISCITCMEQLLNMHVYTYSIVTVYKYGDDIYPVRLRNVFITINSRIKPLPIAINFYIRVTTKIRKQTSGQLMNIYITHHARHHLPYTRVHLYLPNRTIDSLYTHCCKNDARVYIHPRSKLYVPSTLCARSGQLNKVFHSVIASPFYRLSFPPTINIAHITERRRRRQ